jgi:hypothetical protein
LTVLSAPAQLRSREEEHVPAGNPLEIGVHRDHGQVTFERSGGDQGVDVPDQARPARRTHLPPNFSIALQDGVSQKIGRDFAQKLTQAGSVRFVVAPSPDVLDQLAVDEDAGGRLPGADPGSQ